MNRMSLDMECLHMYIVIALLTELFSADGALIGCLSCVGSDMVIQVILSEESFPTKDTLVLFLPRMFPNMQLQIILMNERFSTLITRIRTNVLVTAYVSFQNFFTMEATLTQFTFMWPVTYTHVDPFVCFKVALHSKTSIAYIALERLHTSMRS